MFWGAGYRAFVTIGRSMGWDAYGNTCLGAKAGGATDAHWLDSPGSHGRPDKRSIDDTLYNFALTSSG